MTWVKRNLGLVISGVISLVLLGLASYYLLRQKATADEASTNLQGKTEELQRLVNRNPGASTENITAAKEDQKKIETFLAEMKQFFVAPAYPTGLHSRAFGVHLSDKIDELRHTAKASGVTLPTDFQFSFASQMKVPSIAPTVIEPLALQLAEIESICNVLFHAKINELDSVRRSPVTADETAGIGDFLDSKPTTNEYTIISPYDVKFKGFSVDLANVLEGLIKASNCITVRDIVVQRTDAAQTNEENSASMPYQYPMQGMNSSQARYRGMSPDMMRRYGLRPPTPQVPTTPTTQPGGRPTVGVIQDEHQLSVTLSLLTVRNNLSGKVPKAAAPAAAPLDPTATPDPNAPPAQADTQPATATE